MSSAQAEEAHDIITQAEANIGRSTRHYHRTVYYAEALDFITEQ